MLRGLRVALDVALLAMLSAVCAAGLNGGRWAMGSVRALPWKGDWAHDVETQAFRAGIPVVGLAAVREMAGDVEEASSVLLDARPEELYRAGHLPGALSCPAGNVEAALGRWVERLSPEMPTVVYCDGLGCADSLEVAMKLKAMGFEAVRLYPGGFAEWTAYGEDTHAGDTP